MVVIETDAVLTPEQTRAFVAAYRAASETPGAMLVLPAGVRLRVTDDPPAVGAISGVVGDGVAVVQGVRQIRLDD